MGEGQSLQAALTAYRRQVAQLHVAQNFEVAFDLLLFNLCRSVFHYGWDNPFDLSIKAGAPFCEPDDMEESTAGIQLQELERSLPIDWVKKPPMEAYAQMCLLPDADKQRLFCWVTGHALKGQLSSTRTAGPVFEMAGTQLDIDMATYWRPGAETFWQRIKKDTILEIAEEVLGKDWRINHNHLKKGELARKMGTIFVGSGTPSIPADVLEKAKRWLPEGMGFGMDSIAPQEVDDGFEAETIARTPEADISEPEVAAPQPIPILTSHKGTNPSNNEGLPDFLRDVG